jgi:hypothetical protein
MMTDRARDEFAKQQKLKMSLEIKMKKKLKSKINSKFI